MKALEISLPRYRGLLGQIGDLCIGLLVSYGTSYQIEVAVILAGYPQGALDDRTVARGTLLSHHDNCGLP